MTHLQTPEKPGMIARHDNGGMTMKTRIKTAFVFALAGVASALAISAPAGAATPDQLPGLGYSVTETNLGVINGSNCHDWRAAGYGANVDFGSDCDPGFQQALDSFVAGHPERKLQYEHPAAVGARASLQGKGYSVSTDYGTPTFTVTGGCGINTTTDSAGIVALDASLGTAAPCPVQAPPPTTTTTTSAPTTTAAPSPAAPAAPSTGATTAPTAPESPAGGTAPTTTAPATPSVDAQLAALEARIAALEAEIAALTSKVDRIAAASDAAWLAYEQALLNGSTPAEAAAIARGTGMNVIYQLGAYAP